MSNDDYKLLKELKTLVGELKTEVAAIKTNVDWLMAKTTGQSAVPKMKLIAISPGRWEYRLDESAT